MPGSTYSSNLKIELMTTGENSGTWGSITNTNLGTALEQAVVGYGNPDYLSDANLTLTLTDTNAAQAARALVLNVTSSFGSLTATRELVVPTIQKQYIVQNNTTGGQSITVKTTAGTGITVPNGRKAHLYVNGTDVIQMFDFVDINGGTIDGTPVGSASASTGAFTTLNASGATTLDGTVALGNAAGDLITVPGTVNSNLIFTDNTYDIGASGATRPRNLFLAGAATVGGNLSVGGTLTLTGGVNLNGNVTVGDTSADTLTINATITSNLIFTDNTYDIGASGATRPRNLFLAGNSTVGGNQTLTGALIVDSTTDSTSTLTGSIQTDGGVGIAKALFVGTTTNMAGALTYGGVTLSNSVTGTGSMVLSTSPTLVTPALGTPSSGVVTNLTGTASININGTVGATTANTGAFTVLTASSDSTFSSTGALTISKGTTGERPTATSGMLRFNTTTTEFEGYNGTTWASVGGAALSNDTSTATNIYPLSAAATTGTASTLYTSNAKFLYKPSTGELQASQMVASNGIVVNSQTVAASYTIAAGFSAMSSGPITVASGQSVTVSSGSRWVVV
jgi:hypothetical protein